MPNYKKNAPSSPSWAAKGDVNAFFGLMLDNIADLLLTIGLLAAVFAFPTDFALQYMVPGTAIGVLVGDLLFFWMALALVKRTGRSDVTAMPLGLDTPSSLGMVFFVLGPAYASQFGDISAAEATDTARWDAAAYAWKIGICSIFISGLFKLVCAFFSDSIRRFLPRAGLLGSLAAVALVLISFLPLIEILHFPIVGMISLSIILGTLVARVPLPFKTPGALGALLVGGVVYYSMSAMGLLPGGGETTINPSDALMPTGWLEVFQVGWLSALQDSLHYLPIVIPFALGTVIGGIDCTESAAAAGDEFPTNKVIAVEALATIAASLCGGVIQTTPYIGHPAYKAMGGRSAYTLATALFVGGAGLLGYFGFLYLIIPKATISPILIFIGLEITAQSFQATDRKHYPAVAFACVPALAALAAIFADKILNNPALLSQNIGVEDLGAALHHEIRTLQVLSSGFIVTSLLWASCLAAMIDQRLPRSAGFLGIAAACALFGVIHSPLPGGALFWPWMLEGENLSITMRYTIGYAGSALLLAMWGLWLNASGLSRDLQGREIEKGL